MADLTQVSTICGGCIPLIEEMLGSASLAVAELVSKQDLGRGIFRFQFRPVDQEVVASIPGQHILIQGRVNSRWVTRAYTLTSPSQATESYEITVKREELGEFSRWLCDIDFMDKEKLCDRQVQADRDWIVPPISASTTPVWAAPFDSNRKIKPGYFYSPEPWKAGATLASGCPFHQSFS